MSPTPMRRSIGLPSETTGEHEPLECTEASRQTHLDKYSEARLEQLLTEDKAEARAMSTEFAEKSGTPYPAIKRLWENAWSKFVPFLDYGVEIRKIICSTKCH
jgi:transposase-like protein